MTTARGRRRKRGHEAGGVLSPGLRPEPVRGEPQEQARDHGGDRRPQALRTSGPGATREMVSRVDAVIPGVVPPPDDGPRSFTLTYLSKGRGGNHDTRMRATSSQASCWPGKQRGQTEPGSGRMDGTATSGRYETDEKLPACRVARVVRITSRRRR